MRANIQPISNIFGGDALVAFEVSDARVVSGIPAIPEVPAIVANPEANPPILGQAAIPAVPAVPGNIDCQIAFYTANGQQAGAQRARLTPEQYEEYCGTEATESDDAFFLACHVARIGLTVVS